MNEQDTSIPVESVRRLDVHPGETLVFKVTDGAVRNPEELRELADRITSRLPDGVQSVILAAGVDLDGVVTKRRRLPLRRTHYTDEQWTDLEQWLTSLGQHPNEVADIAITDTEATVTVFKVNSEGKRYAIGDDVASTYITVPLVDAPAWFTEVAA